MHVVRHWGNWAFLATIIVTSRAQAEDLPHPSAQAIPPGYYLASQKRDWLVTLGTLTLTGTWLVGVGGAAAGEFQYNSGFLFIPVLGPCLAFLPISVLRLAKAMIRQKTTATVTARWPPRFCTG